MIWGDGITHWVSYEPYQMGKDLVVAQCGETVHITQFSSTPSCDRCPMTDYIKEFSGQYRYLSNFFIEPDGTHVEGEYQSRKTDPPDENVRRMSPNQAKVVGRRLRLRPDWETIKLGVMHELVYHKFDGCPPLREALKRTGAAYLEEGNWWGDRFWGTVDGMGQNHLGKILMRVRREV